MLREDIAVTGTRHCGRARKCWHSKWPTGAAGSQQAPGRKGCCQEAAARIAAQLVCSGNSRTSGTLRAPRQARYPHLPADTGSSTGAQLWPCTCWQGGRKQNRSKLARWAGDRWAHRPLGVLESPPLAVCYSKAGQTPGCKVSAAREQRAGKHGAGGRPGFGHQQAALPRSVAQEVRTARKVWRRLTSSVQLVTFSHFTFFLLTVICDRRQIRPTKAHGTKKKQVWL